VEHDAECAQAEASQLDYLATICAFTSSSKHSINFNQMLEECDIFLALNFGRLASPWPCLSFIFCFSLLE
jgi:hypothetical protein